MSTLVMMFFTGLTFLSLSLPAWAGSFDDGTTACVFNEPNQPIVKQCLLELSGFTEELRQPEDAGLWAKLFSSNVKVRTNKNVRILSCEFIHKFCLSELMDRSKDLTSCLNDGQRARMESPRQEKSQKFCVAALKKNKDYTKIEFCFEEQQTSYQDLDEPALARCMGISGDTNDQYPQALIDQLNKNL